MSIDDQFQVDLCDMSSLADYNNKFKYLLTCIDCFSKYAWVECLYSKSGSEIANAFQRIFKKDNRIPKKIQSDKGPEFVNSTVQNF